MAHQARGHTPLQTGYFVGIWNCVMHSPASHCRLPPAALPSSPLLRGRQLLLQLRHACPQPLHLLL